MALFEQRVKLRLQQQKVAELEKQIEETNHHKVLCEAIQSRMRPILDSHFDIVKWIECDHAKGTQEYTRWVVRDASGQRYEFIFLDAVFVHANEVHSVLDKTVRIPAHQKTLEARLKIGTALGLWKDSFCVKGE